MDGKTTIGHYVVISTRLKISEEVEVAERVLRLVITRSVLQIYRSGLQVEDKPTCLIISPVSSCSLSSACLWEDMLAGCV